MGRCLDVKLLEIELSYDTTCFQSDLLTDNFIARRGVENPANVSNEFRDKVSNEFRPK